MQAKMTTQLCRLAACVLGVSLAAPLAGQDTACKPVFDAMTKVLNTPTHVYNNGTSPAGQARSTEAIYGAGAIFVKTNGAWKKSPMTPQRMQQQEEENRRNSKYSCRHVQDESVGGESAAVYTAHAETEDTKSDSRIWISKNKGLPLRQELDIDSGGGPEGKTHHTIRYEYSNVKPPVP